MQTSRHARITQQPVQPRRFPPFAVPVYGTRSDYVEDAYSGTISIEMRSRFRGNQKIDTGAMWISTMQPGANPWMTCLAAGTSSPRTFARIASTGTLATV